MRAKDKKRIEAINMLRETLKPGTVIYCNLKHVSRSGMMREISLHTVKDGSITWITGLTAIALQMRIGNREGLRIGGCGMDMGFALVSNLAHTLYPNGFLCTGKDCPDHKEPGHHASGSYAFRHRWI